MELALPSGFIADKDEFILSGNKIFEYRLVLHPHEELWNRIITVINEFAEKYKSPHAKWGKPHITLVNFLQHQLAEERIVNRLKVIAMGYRPIKIELKNYGSFPSHTIYINITSKVAVQNLVTQIRTETQRLIKLNDDNKPHFIMEPHLTIARKLQPWQYEQGWLEYSHKHFTGKFIAKDMLLLKRPLVKEGGIPQKFEITGRFVFENWPVATKQGELFM